MKRIPLFILLLSTCMLLQAQESLFLRSKSPRKSTHKSTSKNKLIQMDLEVGPGFDLAHRGEGNMLTSMTDMGRVSTGINLRVQYFFSQKWGLYANLRGSMGTRFKGDGATKLIQTLETNYYVDDIEDYSSKSGTTGSLDVGVSYRIENSRWAFYPRLGIGGSFAEMQNVHLKLKKKGSNEMYEVWYDDKLEGNMRSVDMFIVSAGLGVNYKLFRFCYLSLNVAYTQPIGRATCIEYVHDSYTNKEVDRSVYRSTTLGRNLNISAGFGIPIYLGRR